MSEVVSMVRAAMGGDLEAFNQLVLEYQDAVYAQAYWLLQDEARAEDIAQDTFIQAFRNLAQFKGGSFRAWLLRIATNASYDELRRRKRRQDLSLSVIDDDSNQVENSSWLIDQGPATEELVERGQFHATIRREINRLPAEFRMAINLVDLLGMDYQEAAQSLGIPTGTLKSRLARGRLRLRQNLESSPDFGPWQGMSGGETRSLAN